jgi:hypothetical protein
LRLIVGATATVKASVVMMMTEAKTVVSHHSLLPPDGLQTTLVEGITIQRKGHPAGVGLESRLIVGATATVKASVVMMTTKAKTVVSHHSLLPPPPDGLRMPLVEGITIQRKGHQLDWN